MKTLENKVVAITGAGSGFGRALALELVARQAIPVLLDVDEKGLAATSGLIAERGGRTLSQKLDVRSVEQWEAALKAIVGEFGQVDALVNNAGVMCRPESFLEFTEEHGRFIFEVNFWGMVHGMRVFAPELARRPEANIVNVASTLALIGTPMHSIYCASKAAVNSFAAVVRQELAQTGVAVSTVFPGPSKTNLGRNVPVDSEEARKANVANFEKFAITTPEQVAKKIVGAILHDRKLVTTSADGALAHFMQRVSPMGGHALMGTIYRKVSDPKQFARLKGLAPAK